VIRSSQNDENTLDKDLGLKKKKDSEDSNDDEQPDGKKSSRKKDGQREKTFERKEKSPDGEK
jgi:hypothetical protein